MAHVSFTVKINEFADLSSKEFASIYNGFKGESATKVRPTVLPADLRVSALPASVDWRSKGVVTGEDFVACCARSESVEK
jgi:hypothetical protein